MRVSCCGLQVGFLVAQVAAAKRSLAAAAAAKDLQQKERVGGLHLHLALRRFNIVPGAPQLRCSVV